MQRFHYRIEHICGEDNVWADLMTRWGANPDETEATQKLVRRVRAMNVPADARVRPLQNPGFVWPNIAEIRYVQKKWLPAAGTMKRNDDGLIVTDSGKVTIPPEAEDLRRRLCIIAHAGGNSGHLGYQATAQKLTQFFKWESYTEDVKAVCSSCLHCLPTRGGVRIPRPLGMQLHGSRPNEVVHMDWIYIWPMRKNGIHEYQWNFILRDDLSGMIKMTPANQPDTFRDGRGTDGMEVAIRDPAIAGLRYGLLFRIDDDEGVRPTVQHATAYHHGVWTLQQWDD